ncbi:MAG: tRNA (guanosine(37)-N1)-methyltransferase TrmD [Elusimicrobia bacterium]|nr:tRNA (guanosine(37)-N1)-methyltransferase TrmD [Elusimicrobiota bacterium]
MSAKTRIEVLTLFPKMFECIFSEGIVGRARKNKIIEIKIRDIRKYSGDKNRKVDDRPYGGGSGMVMKAGPVHRAIEDAGGRVILLSPQGKQFNQAVALALSRYRRLLLVCGRYEGIDERIMKDVDEEISIGDYVLTGGELPAMVVVDSVVRLIPGVIKESESFEKDSFFDGLLDYPHYTRPRNFRGMKVPDVLLSGNHEKIRLWRARQSLKNTLLKRRDLLERAKLSREQKDILLSLKKKYN